MLFSYKQFEETKNQIIKQFEQKPNLQYEYQNNTTLNEYKKLLNNIIHDKKKRKKNNTEINVQDMQDAKSMRQFRKRLTDRNVSRVRTANVHSVSKRQNKEQFIRNSVEMNMYNAQQNNIYITNVADNSSKMQKSDKNAQLLPQSAKQIQKNDKLFSAVHIQEQREQALDPQHQEMLNLRVNIFEQANQQKYMYTEIAELEQAIRYYKKLNTKLESQLQSKQRRHNTAIKQMLKTQTNLNNATYNKKYFQERFENIQNYFSRSLNSMKVSKKNQTNKCTEMVDTIVENILTLKYLQQKKDQQKLQLQKLQQKSRYKMRKIEQSKNMHKYAQILLKMYRVSNYIRNNSYGKINQYLQFQEEVNRTCISVYFDNRHNSVKERITEIMDKSYINKSNNQDLPHCQLNDINFLNLMKEILKSYFKLRSDQEKLKQIYEEKIIQIQGSRKSLHKQLSQKIMQLDLAQKNQTPDAIIRLTTSSRNSIRPTSLPTFHILPPSISSYSFSPFSSYFIEQQQLKKTQQRLQKINETVLLFKQRVKFFIKKCILRLENIIEKWLKFDQSAINFVIEIVDMFIIVGCEVKQNFNIMDSRSILMKYFQNWEEYTFFIQYLHANSILCSVLTTNILKNTLKRVIKTKKHYPEINTKSILTKVLKKLHHEKSLLLTNNIKSLLKIGVDLIQYSLKYQVLIVNCFQMPIDAVLNASNNIANTNTNTCLTINKDTKYQTNCNTNTNRTNENKSEREQSQAQQFFSKFISAEPEKKRTQTPRHQLHENQIKIHSVESDLDDTSSQVNTNKNENLGQVQRKCKKSVIKEEFVTACILQYQENISNLAKAYRMHQQI